MMVELTNILSRMTEMVEQEHESDVIHKEILDMLTRSQMKTAASNWINHSIIMLERTYRSKKEEIERKRLLDEGVSKNKKLLEKWNSPPEKTKREEFREELNRKEKEYKIERENLAEDIIKNLAEPITTWKDLILWLQSEKTTYGPRGGIKTRTELIDDPGVRKAACLIIDSLPVDPRFANFKYHLTHHHSLASRSWLFSANLSLIMDNVVTEAIEERGYGAAMRFTTAFKNTYFALGNGTKITWGEATIEHHDKRIHMMKGKATSIMEDVILHEQVKQALIEAGVECLNELPDNVEAI